MRTGTKGSLLSVQSWEGLMESGCYVRFEYNKVEKMGEISCLFLQSKNLRPALVPEKGGFWIFAPFHLWKMETRNSQTRPSVAVFWSRAVGSKSLWNSFSPNFFPELILGSKNALIHSTNFKFLPSNLYPFRIPPPGSNFSAQNFKIFKTSKREISNFRNFPQKFHHLCKLRYTTVGMKYLQEKVDKDE